MVEATPRPEEGPEPTADEIATAGRVNGAGGEPAGDAAGAAIEHAPGEPAAAEPTEPKVHPRLAQLNELAARAHADDKFEPLPGAEPAPAPAGEPATPAAAPVVEPAGDGEKRFDLQVNGKTIQVTEAELIRRAQKSDSADERFQAAARLREDAERRVADAEALANSRPGPTPAAAPADGEGSKTPGATQDGDLDARAAKLAHDLQYGDESEAAAAAKELLLAKAEGRGDPAPTAEQIGDVVNRTLVQRDLAQSYQDAQRKVGEEYADIIVDEDLRTLAAERVHKERAKDIIALGYPEDEVAPYLRTPEGRRELLQLHQFCQVNPGTAGRVRSTYDVFKSSFEGVKTRFAKPADPSPTPAPSPSAAASDPARAERKTRLPQSPAPASARIAVPSAPPPKTPKQVINDMRVARGQPPA